MIFCVQVVWLSHGMFKSSCEISVEYFPFDIQDCTMKWASWTYDGYSVGGATDTRQVAPRILGNWRQGYSAGCAKDTR